MTPLPGCTPTKPGSACFPFFGVVAVILDEAGKVNQKKSSETFKLNMFTTHLTTHIKNRNEHVLFYNYGNLIVYRKWRVRLKVILHLSNHGQA